MYRTAQKHGDRLRKADAYKGRKNGKVCARVTAASRDVAAAIHKPNMLPTCCSTMMMLGEIASRLHAFCSCLHSSRSTSSTCFVFLQPET